MLHTIKLGKIWVYICTLLLLGITILGNDQLIDPEPTYSDLYEYPQTSGDIINVLITNNKPTSQEINKFVTNLESEAKERCGVLIVYMPKNRIWIETSTKCKEKTHAIDSDLIKNRVTGLENFDKKEEIKTFLVEQVYALLKPKGDVVKSFYIEFEKNQYGGEFIGLSANHGNKLMIEIFYPTKYGGSNVRYDATERSGTVEFQDSDCKIDYNLEDAPGPYIGKLELDESSLYDSSSIILHYHPGQVLPNENPRESFKASINCPHFSDSKSKMINIDNPYLFLIHGLWNFEKHYAKIMKFLKHEYTRNLFYFDYVETNVGDIRISSNVLKRFIELKISDSEKNGIKVGKVDIVAHSLGGLISKYYISDLEGYKKVDQIITLGTAHLGVPLMDVIWKACPYDRIMISECNDYIQIIEALKEVFGAMLGEQFGEIGKACLQMSSGYNPYYPEESTFTRNGMKKIPPGTTKFIIIAGTKTPVPISLKGVPGVLYTIEAVESAFRTLKQIPESMQDTLHQFLMSFMEEGTDSRAPIGSALWWDGYPDSTPSPNSLDYERYTLPLYHIALHDNEVGQEFILCHLQRKKCTFAATGSPVNLYAIDESGNTVGIKEDVLQEEVQDAKFFVGENNVQSIIINNDDEYSYVIESFGNGSFSFTVSQITEDKSLSLFYENVTIIESTKAFFDLNDEDHLLDVDRDGDGIIDDSVEPVFRYEVKLESEKDIYTKSGLLQRTGQNESKKKVLLLSMLVGLVIILIISYLVKRHYSR
ncbi:MAG: hypothetical protein ABIC04_08925 [Nanoarchaeota archaeon]